MRKFSFNKKKAFNAMLLLLREYPGIKKTQIMKFFFLADFQMFYKNESPIFGGVYIHMDRGPVPVEVNNKLLPHMINSNFIRVKKQNGLRHFLNTDVEPDLEVFNVTELDIIYGAISFLKHLKTSREVSNFTHNLDLWKLTKNGEPIPYELVHMCKEEIHKYLEDYRFYKSLASTLPTPEKVPDDYWDDYEVNIPVSFEKEMIKTAFEN